MCYLSREDLAVFFPMDYHQIDVRLIYRGGKFPSADDFRLRQISVVEKIIH